MKSRFHDSAARVSATRQRGLSLVELMVALTIGSILLAGTVFVYVQSRGSYGVNEAVARLQENARYAMSVIEPDVRMANYWGLVKGASVVTQQAAPADGSLGAPTSCGNNFAHNLLSNVEGGNNAYALGCVAEGGGEIDSADTLTIRRASTAIQAVTVANTLQICSTRVMGRLIGDGTACTAAPAGQVNDLIVHTYYVSRQSDDQATVPALRRQALIAGPAFVSQEIVPGVEDMQVQFGIDPTGIGGDAATYVNPDDVPVSSQIVSVRIWLLVRAEAAEVGFTDDRTYEYGDRLLANGTTADLNAVGAPTRAYAPADGFRRMLVSRTFRIRNALGT